MLFHAQIPFAQPVQNPVNPAHKQIDEGKKQDEKKDQNQISHKITSKIRSGNISADRGSGQGPGWCLLRKNWSAA